MQPALYVLGYIAFVIFYKGVSLVSPRGGTCSATTNSKVFGSHI